MVIDGPAIETPPPQLIATIEDPAVGLRGYIVVDSTVNGQSCGGMRMFSDVTVEEVTGLARSMTLKYGFNGMAQGGAKAGIAADPDMPDEQKRAVLRRWGEIAAPLLLSRSYITGTDMNVGQGAIDVVHAAAGYREPPPRRGKGNKSGLYTGYGVMIVSEAAAAFRGVELDRCRVAVEGFGAVGSAYAMLMAKKKGARVVAISTTRGAIYHPDGLDIDRLLALRAEHGHRVVETYDGAERIAQEDLLTLDVDLLAPCARIHSIHAGNAGSIRATMVCPGANIPVTPEAEAILHRRGIAYLPDFTANWGGVLGNKLEALAVDDAFIETFFRDKNRQRLVDLLRAAEAAGEPAAAIAERYAMDRFARIKAAAEARSAGTTLKSLALRVFNMGLIPEFICRPLAPYYFERALGADEPIR